MNAQVCLLSGMISRFGLRVGKLNLFPLRSFCWAQGLYVFVLVCTFTEFVVAELMSECEWTNEWMNEWIHSRNDPNWVIDFLRSPIGTRDVLVIHIFFSGLWLHGLYVAGSIILCASTKAECKFCCLFLDSIKIGSHFLCFWIMRLQGSSSFSRIFFVWLRIVKINQHFNRA